jgi:hypothetical protein
MRVSIREGLTEVTEMRDAKSIVGHLYLPPPASEDMLQVMRGNGSALDEMPTRTILCSGCYKRQTEADS